jgi:hypothetical protein
MIVGVVRHCFAVCQVLRTDDEGVCSDDEGMCLVLE